MSDFYKCPKCEDAPEARDISMPSTVDPTDLKGIGETIVICPLCKAESKAGDWHKVMEDDDGKHIPILISGAATLAGAIRISIAIDAKEKSVEHNSRLFMEFFTDAPLQVIEDALAKYYEDKEEAHERIDQIKRAVWKANCANEELMRAAAGHAPNEFLKEENYEKAG